MNKYFLIFILVILGLSGIILADEFKEGTKIIEGKNTINFNSEFSPIYVKDLINLYPEITTVTYNNGTQETGYVNAFGGIGENFIILSNKTYEITTKQEINITLK